MYYPETYQNKCLKLNHSDIDLIKNWYQDLVDIGKDIEQVRVPLNRLNYAMHERINPIDAIIDAVTAWEAMFSGRYETNFTVTGSIAKFLKPENERKEFLKKLKKFYDFRSKIVHGENKTYSNDEKSEIIKIGLACLKKLLKDKTLLTMSPQDRAHKILVFS